MKKLLAKMKSNKKKTFIILLALVIGGYLIMPKGGSGTLVVATQPLMYTDIQNNVATNGTLVSNNEKTIYSPSSANVEELFVEVGDVVEEGQLLARLDSGDLEDQILIKELEILVAEDDYKNSVEDLNREYDEYLSDIDEELDSQLSSAKSVYDNAADRLVDARRDVTENDEELDYADEEVYLAERAREKAFRAMENAGEDYEEAKDEGASAEKLKELEAAWDLAEIAYNEANNEYEEVLRIYGDNLSGYVKEYHDAKIAFDAAEQSYEIAKLASERKVEDFERQIERLDTNPSLQLSYLQLKNLNEELDSLYVKAPISGIVSSMSAKIGAPASGEMFVIEDPNDIVVSTTIREYDIANVKEGLPVVIQSDATGEEIFNGEVEFVSPIASKNSNSAVEFASEIKFNETNSELRLGMNVYADIIVDEAKNVFTVPISALSMDMEGNEIVYITSSNNGVLTAKSVIVETGVENAFSVEISSSELSEGTEVIIDAGAVYEGAVVTTPFGG